MAGVSPEGMGACERAFRPSLHAPGFETIEKAAADDRRNAKLIRREVAKGTVTGLTARPALELADRMDPGELGDPASPVPNSMASRRYMRDFRDRVCGHMWKLLEDREAYLFSVVERGSGVPVEELAHFDPRVGIRRLRSALNRCGAVGTGGLLFAALDGEYQLNTGETETHMHGFVGGDLIESVDRLRDVRAYKSPRRKPGDPKLRVSYRVVLSKTPLHSLPSPLTYIYTSYWPARWTTPEGRRTRKIPMKGPALVHALLWRDRWSPSDITLMMGMRANQSGFTPLNRTRV